MEKKEEQINDRLITNVHDVEYSQDSIVDIPKEKSSSLVDYCKEYKSEIFDKSLMVLLAGTSIYFGGKYFKTNKLLKKKNIEINDLKGIISKQGKTISQQSKRIIQLEKLCEIKDEFFKYSISDGLKHRSPWAAQKMAEKRWS